MQFQNQFKQQHSSNNSSSAARYRWTGLMEDGAPIFIVDCQATALFIQQQVDREDMLEALQYDWQYERCYITACRTAHDDGITISEMQAAWPNSKVYRVTEVH